MCDLINIEKKQNVKFPKGYKKFYRSSLKAIKNKIEIHIDNDIFCIRKFLTAVEINNVIDELYDFFGYDIIPIAETDDDDYICLYFRRNRENPSIIHWNYELAFENVSEGITFLYNNINEFLNDLF